MSEKIFGRNIKSSDVSRNFKKSHSSYHLNKLLLLGLMFTALLVTGFLVIRFFPKGVGEVEKKTKVDTTSGSTWVVISDTPEGSRKPIPVPAPKLDFNIHSFNDVTFEATGNRYSIFSIDFIPELSGRIMFQNTNGQSIGSFMSYIRRMQSMSPSIFSSDDDFFAITGAMYENDNLPPGLVVTGGVRLKDLNTMPGNGNFYEPAPNGVFYVDDTETGIVPTRDYSVPNPDFALQSGPMLVIDYKLNPGITNLNARKYNRCAVGIRKFGKSGKTLVFVSSLDKVTMAELARYMKSSLNCSDAMHLETINAYIHFPGSNFPVKNQSIKNFIIIK